MKAHNDTNDTKNKPISSMLKIEHGYETPIESNCYQNKVISSNPQEPDNNQETTNYTPR